MAVTSEVDLTAGGYEGRPPLRRELGRLDTVLFLVSAMVVLDTLGAVSVGGGQVLTWLFVLAVTFFVPSALITSELGAALPAEGGAYVWVREAFGPRRAAFASLLYWAGTPVWVGGSVAVVALSVVEAFVAPLSAGARVGLGLAFVAVCTLGGVVPLRYGKWVPNSGALAQVALLAFFTVSAVGYGVRHGMHRFTEVSFAPTAGVFVAVVPVLLYSFVGVELPTAAAEEMRDPRRDIPAAVARAGVLQTVLYAVPVAAVLAVLPAERITSLGGFVEALRAVLTVYGGTGGTLAGWACAAAFVWVLLASGTTWLMGTSRTQAAACTDGGGPAWLGRISPVTGVPVTMTLVSGAAAAATLVAGLLATGADVQRYFTVTLTGAIAFDLLAFLAVYPSFVALRGRRPDLPRPFRVPGGTATAWLLTAAALGWTAVAVVHALWPGAGLATPDAHLPAGFEGRRAEFELLVTAPLAVVVTAYGVHLAHTARRPAGRRAHR